MTRALLAFVGDQGLWPHRRAGPARLGRPGLGAALRARAWPQLDTECANDHACARRPLLAPSIGCKSSAKQSSTLPAA